MQTIRKRLLYVIAAGSFVAAPLCAQGDCKAVLEAESKMLHTPAHVYLTMDVGGKPHVSETIYSGGAVYAKLNDKWSLSPLTQKDMEQLQEKNRKTSQISCHYVKDELVNGEMAAVFAAHSQTAKGTSDSQIWISKSKGLPLRQEVDVQVGDGGHKSHTSLRCEYGNIKPPM